MQKTGEDKIVIVITGPTASGKTSVAIELAKYFKTEIISADSRQCYKELDIGVARPSIDELKEVPHHFIASHPITHDKINARTFATYALQKATELFEKHNKIIMVGGSGLYIKAFCEGMDDIPDVPDEIRERIVKDYNQFGLSWLKKKLEIMDPAFYQSGEIENPQRMLRALEVIETTGQSILIYRKGEKVKRDFNIIKIGLELPKDELHRNINSRVDQMLDRGLVEEVKNLLLQKHLNALQTVGYTEIFDYFDGKISLPEAADLIKKNTRQYAKRQMTWFKKDKGIKWFSPIQVNKMIEFLGSKTS